MYNFHRYQPGVNHKPNLVSVKVFCINAGINKITLMSINCSKELMQQKCATQEKLHTYSFAGLKKI